MKTHAVASLTDLNNSHEVMWEDALHHLRYSAKYLADIENVGERVEKTA